MEIVHTGAMILLFLIIIAIALREELKEKKPFKKNIEEIPEKK